jgi:hypothetical protein
MKALTVQTKIAVDGWLHLHIPCDLPPGDTEVIVVVQTSTSARSDPPYASDHGVWAGKLPDIDLDADLAEMSRQWEKSLEFPQ